MLNFTQEREGGRKGGKERGSEYRCITTIINNADIPKKAEVASRLKKM